MNADRLKLLKLYINLTKLTRSPVISPILECSLEAESDWVGEKMHGKVRAESVMTRIVIVVESSCFSKILL